LLFGPPSAGETRRVLFPAHIFRQARTRHRLFGAITKIHRIARRACCACHNLAPSMSPRPAATGARRRRPPPGGHPQGPRPSDAPCQVTADQCTPYVASSTHSGLDGYPRPSTAKGRTKDLLKRLDESPIINIGRSAQAILTKRLTGREEARGLRSASPYASLPETGRGKEPRRIATMEKEDAA